MPSYKFNHIALSVKDVAESVDFYQAVFQFQEIENAASGSKTRWLLIDNKIQLHLIPRPDFVVRTNKAVHFAVSTDDLAGAIRVLVDLKIPYSDWHDNPDSIHVRNDGIQQIYFQDPNGYWIEINSD